MAQSLAERTKKWGGIDISHCFYEQWSSQCDHETWISQYKSAQSLNFVSK